MINFWLILVIGQTFEPVIYDSAHNITGWKVRDPFGFLRPARLLHLEPGIAKVVKPPLNAWRIAGEIAGGFALGIGCAVLTEHELDESRKDDRHTSIGEEGDIAGALMIVFGTGAAYVLGSILGVYIVGNIGNETGGFIPTYIGGALSTIFCPIGATIGFNMSRKYRPESYGPQPRSPLSEAGEGRIKFTLARGTVYFDW